MRDKLPQYNSDVLVDELRALGIEYVSLNPGATTRGMHDSIVNYGGNKNPKLILCCHEGIAVAMASGYFRATGRPMVVLLHDIVGLLHATKAIFDAWIDRDAMILIGGNGPIDIEKRRPWIDWIHNALIPNTLVRDYVKWDDQPSNIISAVEDLIRARNITLTEPSGPVYISIDAGLQEEACERETLEKSALTPNFYNPPLLEEGSSLAITSIGNTLIQSERPVIIVDKYGRSDEDVERLIELSEELGVAVLDTGALFNFPSTHPMNLSGLEEETLVSSDAVLILGARDLYFHLAKKQKGFFSRQSDLMVKPDCKIFRVDLEGNSTNSWVTEYGRLTPTTLYLFARPGAAVASLLHYCRKELEKMPRVRQKIEERKGEIGTKSIDLRRKWIGIAEAELKRKYIRYPGLALVTRDLVRKKDWVLAFPGYSARGINTWLRRTWDITKHYQYPGRGAGTGTGTGQALGVALANRGRLCIDFQPDGDLLYSASSLWTAANSKIPLLIIMLNNRSYYNDEEHNRFIALQRGRSSASSRVGIKIENPNVDFSQLAKSYGLKSRGVIEDYDSLGGAVEEGISAVTRSKVPYLVDVLVRPS